MNKNHKTPLRVYFSILCLVLFLGTGIVYADSTGELGSVLNITAPSNSTPVISNVTLDMGKINMNPLYVWTTTFSDNLSDIYYWSQPWGDCWYLDSGTFISLTNTTLVVNTTGIDFPIDDNVTIKDKNSLSDYQVLNFSLTNTSYVGNTTGSNHTHQIAYYNVTYNNRATDNINIIWSIENITDGTLLSGGSGATNGLSGAETNRTFWRGDWLTETWDNAENTSSLNNSVTNFCWRLPLNLSSSVYQINYPNLNWTLSLEGANFSNCNPQKSGIINFTFPTDTVYANFSTPGVNITSTILNNTATRYEKEVTVFLPAGVNQTFMDNNYVNISLTIPVANQSVWNLYQWNGVIWINGNVSGVYFNFPNTTTAQWIMLNNSANVTYRVVGTAEGVAAPSPGPPLSGGPRPSPMLPSPYFKITPRTIDPVLGNIVEPFHAYGNGCKSYDVKNIGEFGGLLIFDMKGYAYLQPMDKTILSADFVSVIPDEIYLVPNASSSFDICVNKSLVGAFDAYVIANSGKYEENILIYMKPKLVEYVEETIGTYLNFVLWESPRPVGSIYLKLRVWNLLALLGLIIVSGAITYLMVSSRGVILRDSLWKSDARIIGTTVGATILLVILIFSASFYGGISAVLGEEEVTILSEGTYNIDPSLMIAPRIDSNDMNIVEPFYSFGDTCKTYSIKNVKRAGLLKLTKQGFQYDVAGASVDSSSFFTVLSNEIYLLPNASAFFRICVDLPPAVAGVYEGYVTASTGVDYNEKIFVSMKIEEDKGIDFFTVALWRSPIPVGGKYFTIRSWQVLALLFVISIGSLFIFFTMKGGKKK